MPELDRGVALAASALAPALQKLLQPETILSNVRFQGNMPYLDAGFRGQLLAAVLVPVAVEAATAPHPAELLFRHFKAVLELPSNLRKIALNRRFCAAASARLDKLDAELVECARLANPQSEPELWETSATTMLTIAREEIATLWSDYKREYHRA